MNDEARADALARALVAAPGGERDAIWSTAQACPPLALAGALKRLCNAAWSADPPATAVIASLMGDLAGQAHAPALAALAAWARGIALLVQGQLEPALQSLSSAHELFLAANDPLEAAQASVARVMALAMLGRYSDAKACGEAARVVFDSHGDAQAAGKIELNLGNLAARRERSAEAIEHYDAALARFTASGEVALEVMAIDGLARMQAAQHQFEAAERLYRQALARADAAGLMAVAAKTDRNLGALLLRRGHLDQALPVLERARGRLAGLALPYEQALAEEWLGDAYLELNLLPEALAIYDSSLASYEAAGAVTDRAWVLLQRGQALALLARYQAAKASLADAEQAFAAEGNPLGTAMVGLSKAEIAFKQGDLASASGFALAAEPALASASHLSAVLQVRLLRAELLLAAGQEQQAEALARQAILQAQEQGLVLAERRGLVLLGRAARQLGDLEAATQCFRQAVDSIESQRGLLPSEEFRVAFLGHNLQPYRELVRSSLARGGEAAAGEALHWVERARARAVMDALVAPQDLVATDEPAEREIAQLRSELDACYRALARPEAADAQRWLDRARGLENTILERGRRQAMGAAAAPAGRSGPAPQALDMPRLHAALGDDSALVEYFSVDQELWACIVADGQVRVQRLPASLDDVSGLVEQLRFQTDTLRSSATRLAHRLPDLQRRALHHLQRLHAWVWAPLLGWLGSRRVAVIPHSTLHYLPFEALHDGQAYEVERREICRAPSAALLLRGLQAAPPTWQTALVLGHADERLPSVATEVAAVAACFAHAQPLTGPAASGDALRSGGDWDVVHIACHAQFRTDNPRFSALHLGDGAFTVRDASRLRLRAGIVTLSACETAVSAVLPGDELIGLTHTFLSAGARRVLASLWTVHDDAAAELMPRLYSRLRAGARPAQALREAQLATLVERPHPYFWAAFALYGGW